MLCPAVLMVLWQGATPRRGRAARILVQRRHFCRRDLLALHEPAHLWPGADLDGLRTHARAGCASWARIRRSSAGVSRASCPERGAAQARRRSRRRGSSSSGGAAGSSRGFAWLSLGYSQTDTGLQALRRCVGVYCISALLLTERGRARDASIEARARRGSWALRGARFAVACRDGARADRLDARRAASPSALRSSRARCRRIRNGSTPITIRPCNLYRELTVKALGTPLIVWPESAPPDLTNNLVDYLMQRSAHGERARLGAGAGRRARGGRWRAVLQLRACTRRAAICIWYDKSHLVPFAEFFPVPGFVREWLRLRNLPNEDFTRGADSQPPLRRRA